MITVDYDKSSKHTNKICGGEGVVEIFHNANTGAQHLLLSSSLNHNPIHKDPISH
jgi:hypothetical protein